MRTDNTLRAMDRKCFEAWCAFPEYRVLEAKNLRRWKRLEEIQNKLGMTS